MPFLSDYPRYALQMLRGERSAGERAQLADLQRDLAACIDLSYPRDILDLANGRLQPQYALLKATGHRVYGIDYVNRPAHSKTDLAYLVARQIYRLQQGLPPEPRQQRTLVCGDVGRLPFPDAAFDLVVSAAAFEHFLDVPAVVADLHRVLRPGGLAWIAVHLFSCITGGHNLTFTYPVNALPVGVEPWDHLRSRCQPFTVPLNEWRKDQYVAEFAHHLELIKIYCRTREGEQWLTPALEAELSAYTRDELTCGQLVIVARKTG
ncbi:class I SAM-dependent methyltransferase [Candidatus Chloroploca sp. M-50]|uniref:Class I SAM-dependent methyltransferase n=1 Tax=Candidatus Chloroploca mongolica TaxID=2528176 RepID=A0ABS4DCY5_9CHLR|nr:class I SAM-dependent methyltransferase [Candidatus Chloroploca mongolica]MBP1467305.1 class I SAM-dependent methyltransferase [Candidatus Chloroploca mongolica]